jgi:hypothetical protein
MQSLAADNALLSRAQDLFRCIEAVIMLSEL